MTDLEIELAHLIRLSETSPAFYEYAMTKAQSLAAKEPAEMNSLPLLLKEGLRSRKHGPARPSTKPKSECVPRS